MGVANVHFYEIMRSLKPLHNKQPVNIMPIIASTQTSIDKLYTTYQTLTEYEQTVLKVLAITYAPIGITAFNAVLSHVGNCGVFSLRHRLVALAVKQRKMLEKQGFIEHGSDGLILNRLLVNVLVRDCITENTFAECVECIDYSRSLGQSYNYTHAYNAYLTRSAYFLGKNPESVFTFHKNPQIIDVQRGEALVELMFAPFDLEAFLTLSDTMQYQSFAAWRALNQKNNDPSDYLLYLLEQVLQRNPANLHLGHLCADIYLFDARLESVEKIMSPQDTTCYGLQIRASLLFFQGEHAQAQGLFHQALLAKNKYGRRKKPYLTGFFALLHRLNLLTLASQNSVHYDAFFNQLDAESNVKDSAIEAYFINEMLKLVGVAFYSGGEFRSSTYLRDQFDRCDPLTFHQSVLLDALGNIWFDQPFNKKAIKRLEDSECFFIDNHLRLFASVIGQIKHTLQSKQPALKWRKKNQELTVSAQYAIHFPTLIRIKEKWDIALEQLIALNPSSTPALEKPKPKNDNASRLIWEMDTANYVPTFKAREQKLNSKGWSKGRRVALKRLATDYASIDFLTDADIVMCQAIQIRQNWDYYQSKDYVLEGPSALIAAKDVAFLFLEDQLDHSVELIQKEPELLIREHKDALIISMANLPEATVDNHATAFSVRELSLYSYCFTLFNRSHLDVADIVGEGGLLIPKKAKQKVIESVTAIAPLLNIQSDFDELDTGLETHECDSHLVINIQPAGEGLEFTCLVMPFGNDGPAFKPMQGNAQITTELNGKRVATTRNLEQENTMLDALDTHCPCFLAMSDNLLLVNDPQDALEALEQIENLIQQDPLPFLVRVRWPKGKSIKLSKPISEQQLQLAVGKSSEWFDITGELKINEDQVVELRTLLELMQTSSGRFIELDSGQVLALTHDLKQRLDLLHQATDNGRFHALASMQVAEATTGMRLKTNHAWDEQAKKMHESNTIEPIVPSTLQAELRDYQLEGFDWLSRLAHWQAGACLADDMGLGKTLQALALILSRAERGPTLIIAPTSVCFNWQQEALKFAPTLNVVIFSDFTDHAAREQLLNTVSAFDCVVISYGLLQRVSELLANVQWHTIVADEAQALKNPTAKRTQAACALKGDFKIITTGTPIENNLTELWSLFRFIAPGLLGNIKRFGDRYALPIENAKDDKVAAKKASLALKALIQPFILRRMKSQVLTELPARTEINIHVELSQKEQDFYEALRRNAIDNIARASDNAGKGEQRIKMLAELVKLRQACCNPKLVMPETNLSSAKLAALDELLNELSDNNHKALIFSQFVGHLQLIKQHLDKRGMTYQYLDGSTAQKARKESVNAFQKGEGDVFLISLKAGGSGLNLTAADYVIHMDPWWNPAVEDQASDRAHRMGQKRPVTIYRLVAKNTIEERIVALHHHKRDLADKLLAGNEHATKLSVDDMLSMLKENF